MRKYYLAVLTWWNYMLRKRGYLPDEWYWADRELLEDGYGLAGSFHNPLPWPKKF